MDRFSIHRNFEHVMTITTHDEIYAYEYKRPRVQGGVKMHDLSRSGATRDLELARALIQKERLRMVRILQKGRKNISELAEETKLDRATVSYHLSILEKNGIVASQYEMLREPRSKGKIGRYYEINKGTLAKAFRALDRLREEIEPQLSP
jgi:DNA-binding transcriptional ArsR family regulator